MHRQEKQNLKMCLTAYYEQIFLLKYIFEIFAKSFIFIVAENDMGINQGKCGASWTKHYLCWKGWYIYADWA